MDQVYNSMLYMAQPAAERPAAKPGQPQEKDGFQKQMEQAGGKTETKPEAKTESKPETTAQNQPQEGQNAAEDPQELEKQMALAAMAVMQNPVVPVEQVTAPEEAQVTGLAEVEIAVETAETPESAPVTADAAELLPEEGAEEAARQLPQEQGKVLETEARTTEDAGPELEIKVTTGESGETGRETDTQDTPQETVAEAPVFQEVREIPVKVGEAPAVEEAPETPVEDQIGPKLAEALKNGDTRVEIQLAPESLGKVTVEVTLRQDGTLHVALHAENSQTRGLLERSADNLAAMLGRDAQQEVQVEVPRQQESQQQNLYDQQQGHEHQSDGRQQRRRERQSGEDFLHQLRLGLVPEDGE